MNTPCILWNGAVTEKGYGRTTFRRKRTLVHRREWIKARGEIPSGLLVCHHCDTPRCINPDHLFLGTHADNARDCAAKGRKRRLAGEANPRAKLTNETVLAIRSIGAGEKQRDVAARFGVSQKVVWNVLRGKSWQRVKKGDEGADIIIEKLSP